MKTNQTKEARTMRRLLLLVAIMLALVGAGWTWDEGAAHAQTRPTQNDPGDGGGCTIGADWYAGGHHYHCTSWNGVGLVVEIP